MTPQFDNREQTDETDSRQTESSPSTGWRATAELMHVTAGLEECDVLGCGRDGEPFEVVDAGGGTDDVLREGVRCSDHAKEFLEVSS